MAIETFHAGFFSMLAVKRGLRRRAGLRFRSCFLRMATEPLEPLDKLHLLSGPFIR